jgi:hypothetical protein
MTPQPNKNAQQPENRYGIDTLLLIISFLSSLVKNVIISFNLFSLAGLLPKLIELAGKWKEVVNEATDLTKEEWARLGGAFVQELLPFFSAESLSKLIAGTRDLDARDRHWLAGFAQIVPVSRGLADPFNPESYSEDELAQIGQGFMAQLTALTQGSEEIEELNEVQKFLYDLVGDAEAVSVDVEEGDLSLEEGAVREGRVDPALYTHDGVREAGFPWTDPEICKNCRAAIW